MPGEWGLRSSRTACSGWSVQERLHAEHRGQLGTSLPHRRLHGVRNSRELAGGTIMSNGTEPFKAESQPVHRPRHHGDRAKSHDAFYCQQLSDAKVVRLPGLWLTLQGEHLEDHVCLRRKLWKEALACCCLSAARCSFA